MNPIRRRGAAAALAVVLVVLAGTTVACGDDEPSAADGTTTSVPDEGRPPTKFSELQAIFDPMLEPMGLVLTRGALIDRSNNGYEVSPEGRHLALYAEPIDDADFDAEAAAAKFYPLTAEFTPYAFERWSELDTFDICLEPPTDIDDRPEPFPDTQIDITREAAESFDWENGDLTDLLELDLREPEVRTVIGERVREAEPYKSAYEEAQRRVVESSATTLASPN